MEHAKHIYAPPACSHRLSNTVNMLEKLAVQYRKSAVQSSKVLTYALHRTELCVQFIVAYGYKSAQQHLSEFNTSDSLQPSNLLKGW